MGRNRGWASRRGVAQARALRTCAGALLLVALAACAGRPGHAVDAVPVSERELPAGEFVGVPSQPDGQVALAEGVFRVHLSNIRCVRAPCPNGYMVSNVKGRAEALRPGVPQPVSRMPQEVRFDAATGGAVEPGLVDKAHIGEGIVVEGRAWLVDGGSTLRVEVARLLED
ncbi:hypothetical protein LDO26_08790 [Luteimonas sp. BDR2-5]|uniref:hypothetical protein n=1 Tax=Proluteimonas luteida TaxID=2878685 RepID=UPI001E58C4F1|nr:hypothetical protein [Luteimonas sp. BDR2-5]MCD9028305.1 hypothetical protein [Luteimonas sp. BDR2-5]